MAKFLMTELIDIKSFTARLGAGTGAANRYNDTEKGKFVKFAADSRYVLAALGDEIETVIENVDVATSDGYSTGGLRMTDSSGKYLKVTFDGLQGTPGTGVIAPGDYVLVGTVVPKDTSLNGVPPKVVKATTQANAKATPFAWRVVSLGAAGTGAVGTVGLIEKA